MLFVQALFIPLAAEKFMFAFHSTLDVEVFAYLDVRCSMFIFSTPPASAGLSELGRGSMDYAPFPQS
jgi:hypothetical protein